MTNRIRIRYTIKNKKEPIDQILSRPWTSRLTRIADAKKKVTAVFSQGIYVEISSDITLVYPPHLIMGVEIKDL